MKRVFISYRRRDTAREAHVLKAILEARLREVAVFIDTADIPPAVTWPGRLQRELERLCGSGSDRPGLARRAG